MDEFQIRTSKQLSTHLRSLRRSLGLTQTRLGERLGVEQARVAKIEGHPGTISVDQLIEVLNALEAELLVRRRLPAPKAPANFRARW